MSQTKTRRTAKRQLGQFMTPQHLSSGLVMRLDVSPGTRVLEPSFGDGSFIIALIERFLPLYTGSTASRLDAILTRNVFGVEIDEKMYHSCLDKIRTRWGYLPPKHNLVCADFFCHSFFHSFDLIIGNPPFGGTINLQLQEGLDRKYGFRNGEKIKKETYAFFIVKCLDELRADGTLLFICSDTFITIPTMKGLRKLLMKYGSVTVEDLVDFSDETSYSMVLLTLVRSGPSEYVMLKGQQVWRHTMQLTGNFSWAITDRYAKYFAGPKLGEFVTCSSGMTVGKNELFIREIVNETIIEHYDHVFFEDPITVEREVERAKYHKLSPRLLQRVRDQEQSGATQRSVRAREKAPERVALPHPHYRYYNKAVGGIIYSPPTHAIYWKDEGDAVLTFKRNGPWYLHGVGGQPYFGREGLTWQLIASRLNVRYLPGGYILDSGAPCAFLREGIDAMELFFILGWTCTKVCTQLLKTVINHTQNIQSKDFEKLPYPYWVNDVNRNEAISIVRSLIEKAMSGVRIRRTDNDIIALDVLYAYQEAAISDVKAISRAEVAQLPLFDRAM